MLNESRFSALWQRLGCRGDGRALFAELERDYTEPQRAYHSAAHIEDCLAQFDLARHLAERPDEVEAAIWFHDAVYDPRASDNEVRSAEWARQSLIEAGAAADFVERIAELVLFTRHVDSPAGRDGELLLDIDLSILGHEPEAFAVYDAQPGIQLGARSRISPRPRRCPRGLPRPANDLSHRVLPRTAGVASPRKSLTSHLRASRLEPE